MLVIGILFLVTTGIILSSNWNYNIQLTHSTSLSISKISTNNNIYINYKQEELNTVYQISVLQNAIKKNNIMYKEYNNIFKHNIVYNHIQKGNIKNKIKIANSSITREILILNSIKNIISNHPYNYLKFIQEKNYTIPQISYQKITNKSIFVNNIKTYSQGIKKSNVSVKNISYQSEEALIGAAAIISVISSSKQLVFSKVSFDYNCFYYYSTKSNKLSSINNSLVNTNIKNKEEIPGNINKFIKNIQQHKNNDGSNFSDIISNSYKYIDKHVPVFIGSIIGFVASIVVFSQGILVLYMKIKNQIITKVDTVVVPTQSIVSIGYPIVSPPETISENTDHEDRVQSSREIDNSGDSESNLSFREDETNGASAIDDANSDENVVVRKSTRWEPRPISNREIVEWGFRTDESFRINGNNEQKTEQFIRTLYENKPQRIKVSFEDFRSQIIDYSYLMLHVKKPTIESVNRSAEYLFDRRSSDLGRLRYGGSRLHVRTWEIEDKINVEEMTDILNATFWSGSTDETTKFGWFSIPTFKALDENMSQSRRDIIRMQINRMESLMESLPIINTMGRRTEGPSTIIAYQIYHDLKQLILVYQTHLRTIPLARIRHTTGVINENKEEVNTEDRDLYEELINTRLQGREINDLDHIGVSYRDVETRLKDISLLSSRL